MRRKRRGLLTAEDIRMNAERMRDYFSSESVKARLGIGEPIHYYYVYGITEKGKALFLGPLPETEAEDIGSMLGDGEVFELPTRDLARATGEIKAEMILRGKNIDSAIQRLGHKFKKASTHRRGLNVIGRLRGKQV